MPPIAPVSLDASELAEIARLGAETGFVANSMATLAHRPEIASAVGGLVHAVMYAPGASRRPNGTTERRGRQQ